MTIWHEVAGWGPAVMMPHAGICDSGMWGFVLVGASMGGLVALELAIARPDLISSLVLVGSALDDQLWSEPVQRYGEAEEEAAQLPASNARRCLTRPC